MELDDRTRDHQRPHAFGRLCGKRVLPHPAFFQCQRADAGGLPESAGMHQRWDTDEWQPLLRLSRPNKWRNRMWNCDPCPWTDKTLGTAGHLIPPAGLPPEPQRRQRHSMVRSGDIELSRYGCLTDEAGSWFHL